MIVNVAHARDRNKVIVFCYSLQHHDRVLAPLLNIDVSAFFWQALSNFENLEPQLTTLPAETV